MKTKTKATDGNRVAHPFGETYPGNERMSRALRDASVAAPAASLVSDTGARIALAAIIAELGSQEVAVLTLLAKRLSAGQRAYGRIDVANDPRDFEAERGDELADALVYTAFAELRRLARAGGGI